MHVECEACGHVNVLPGADAREPIREPPADDAKPEALTCPKCGAARRADAAACGTCGLATSRMAAFHDAREAAVAEPVRAAWQHVTAAWTDDAGHDALFQRAAAHNAYAWAAGRYRSRGKDPIATRQLERLRRAAEATLLAGATARPDATSKPYRATAGVLVMLVIVVAAGLLYAVFARDRHHVRAPVAPAASGPATGSPRPLVPGHPVSSSTVDR